MANVSANYVDQLPVCDIAYPDIIRRCKCLVITILRVLFVALSSSRSLFRAMTEVQRQFRNASPSRDPLRRGCRVSGLCKIG